MEFTVSLLEFQLNLANTVGVSLNRIGSPDGNMETNLEMKVYRWKTRRAYATIFWELTALLSGLLSVFELHFWLKDTNGSKTDVLVYFGGIVFHGTRLLTEMAAFLAILTFHLYPEIIAWVYNSNRGEMRNGLDGINT